MTKRSMWVLVMVVLHACGGGDAEREDSACGEADLRCEGAQVQRCAGGAWVDEGAPCAFGCSEFSGGEARCEEAPAPACEVGETRCWEAVVQRCDEAGRWQNEESCPFLCSEGACTGDCLPGAERCEGLQPQRCEEGAWTAAGEACPFACEAGACTGACESGATRCWEEVVQVCVDGTWANEASCPFVCVDGVCAGECVPGAARCDGLQPQACVDGHWSDTGEACAYACTDGGCAGVCTPDERRCEGDVLQVCDGDGAWRTEAICPFVCSEDRCAGSCAPGARRCVGDGVELCDEQGAWQAVQRCADGCLDGACAIACDAGEARCFGDVIQLCDPNGQWANAAACPFGCDGGVCLDCTPGATRCAGSAVESCVAPGHWDDGTPCASGVCADGACTDAVATSCVGGGLGVDDCGAGESCCTSLLVPGGAFHQDGDARFPAEVSAFRLDKYEITVGRFRRFVEAMEQGWLPAAGSGRHVHLRGGAGLVERGDGTAEAGWEAGWTAKLPADWRASLGAGYGCNWTDQPGANENKAMNCIHWEEALAFCIWDGGFLPSEAEWNFAAAGGDEQRLYPWGAADPSTGDYAIYMDSCPGGGWCMAPDLVGVRQDGAGRWGHLDLAGNAAEWVLDWYEEPYPGGGTCTDCVNLVSTRTMRGLRGGAHWDSAGLITTDYRYYGSPDHRVIGAGARCARVP